MSRLGNKEIMSKNLKKQIELTGKDRGQIARDIGVKYSTFTDWVNGSSYPRIDKIEIMANYFGIMKSDLVEEFIPEKNLKKVPVLGTIAAGSPIFADQNIEGHELTFASDNIDFCLKVKGDSMINIRIYEGDVVFVKKQDYVENGEVAIVMVNDHEATLKRFYNEGDRIRLRPENPNMEDIIFKGKEAEIVKVIGKVVAVKFKV